MKINDKIYEIFVFDEYLSIKDEKEKSCGKLVFFVFIIQVCLIF